MFIHSSSPRITQVTGKPTRYDTRAESTRQEFLRELDQRMKEPEKHMMSSMELYIESKKPKEDKIQPKGKCKKIELKTPEFTIICDSVKELASVLNVNCGTASKWKQMGGNASKTILIRDLE